LCAAVWGDAQQYRNRTSKKSVSGSHDGGSLRVGKRCTNKSQLN
jgi:hypothetical protein